MHNKNLHKMIISDQELLELTGMQNLRRPSTLSDMLYRNEWLKYFYDRDKSQHAITRPSLIQDENKMLEHFIGEHGINNTSGTYIVGGVVAWFVSFIMLVVIVRTGHLNLPHDVGPIIFLLTVLVAFITNALSSYHNNPKKLSRKLKKHLMPTRLGILLDEVDKYNKIVKDLINHIEAFDQLITIGHPVTFNNREEIITSFQQMRSDLVRALQTERILRERDIRPEQFSLEFVPMKSLEFHGEVQQIAKLVNDATEIGLTVQEEMRKLCLPDNNKEFQETDK